MITFEKFAIGTLITVDKDMPQARWLFFRDSNAYKESKNQIAFLISNKALHAFINTFYSDKPVPDVQMSNEPTIKDDFGEVVKVGDIIYYSSSCKGGVGAVVLAKVEKINKAIRAKVLKSSNESYKQIGDVVTIVTNFVKFPV